MVSKLSRERCDSFGSLLNPKQFLSKLFLFVLYCSKQVNGHFFICPSPCMAMYLPRDMENIEDCLCTGSLETPNRIVLENEMTSRRLLNLELPTFFRYKCPLNSQAKIRGPQSFSDCMCLPGFDRDENLGKCIQPIVCEGKYSLKEGYTYATSLADCKCNVPYTKDDSTGDCFLDHCPRAGNYIPKPNVTVVHSLADCGCISPLTKDDQSGVCFVQFKCPLNSKPPATRPAHSFEDCSCVYGYIKSKDGCLKEQPTYKCPTNSISQEIIPRNFEDCTCLEGYERNEMNQLCSSLNENLTTNHKIYECPEYSIPLALMPYSMHQCLCLPGFIPDLKLDKCVYDDQYYTCPQHSYNPKPHLPAAKFDDCVCAKGFTKNQANDGCVIQLGEYECPESSIINHWPVRNFTDCTCLHGKETSDEFGDGICYPMSSTSTPLFCPEKSILNKWPVTSTSDCTCVWGYQWVKDSFDAKCQPVDAKSFQCPNGTLDSQKIQTTQSNNDTQTNMTCNCVKGRYQDSYSNLCVFPIEKVQGNHEGSLVIHGNEMDFKIIHDNILVTQGDIAVGKSFGFTEKGKHIYHLHGYYNNERDHRWRNGKLCYTMRKDVDKNIIDEAIQHIHRNTGFTFFACKSDCVAKCEDFVEFRKSDVGSYSYIGRIGGKQPIGIAPDMGVGNIVHLILHTLGLHHTIARADRGEHLTITWECIPPQERGNFPIEENIPLSVPYDFYSIMHYRRDAFADPQKKWCASLIPLVSESKERLLISENMGQRKQMSLTDIHYLWSLYPELKAFQKEHNAVAAKSEYHASSIHTKQTASSTTEQGSSFFGGIFCLMAIVCCVLFLYMEYQKQKLRGADDPDQYNDPLLNDHLYD